MTYALGVDMGTTRVVVAIGADGRVDTLPLGDGTAGVAAELFRRPDGSFIAGDAAARAALASPGQGARDFKRRLGDPVPLVVGGVPCGAGELVEELLRRVYQQVLERREDPPSSVTLATPATWDEDRTASFVEAARRSGIPGPAAVSALLAAALDHDARQPVDPGDVVAVYLLGGASFETGLLRRTPGGFELLGRPEGIEQLGGVDFDQAVFSFVTASLEDVVEALDVNDRSTAEALAGLRAACVAAKERLSVMPETTIDVSLDDRVSRTVRLTRQNFDAMVRPALVDSVEALRRAAASAGVAPQEIATIVAGGGSAALPSVADVLREELSRPVAVALRPDEVVARGAARAASGGALAFRDRPAGPVVAQASRTDPPVPSGDGDDPFAALDFALPELDTSELAIIRPLASGPPPWAPAIDLPERSIEPVDITSSAEPPSGPADGDQVDFWAATDGVEPPEAPGSTGAGTPVDAATPVALAADLDRLAVGSTGHGDGVAGSLDEGEWSDPVDDGVSLDVPIEVVFDPMIEPAAELAAESGDGWPAAGEQPAWPGTDDPPDWPGRADMPAWLDADVPASWPGSQAPAASWPGSQAPAASWPESEVPAAWPDVAPDAWSPSEGGSAWPSDPAEPEAEPAAASPVAVQVRTADPAFPQETRLDWGDLPPEPMTHAPAPAAAPYVPPPGPSRTQRPIVVVGVAVAMLAAVIGAVWASSRTDPPKPSPTVHAFAPANLPEGFLLTRTWRLSGVKGDRLRGEVILTNTTEAPLTQAYDEVIPKSVATAVDQLTFEPRYNEVVRADPVVRFLVTELPPEARFELTYTVALPPEGNSQARLDRLAADQVREEAEYKGVAVPTLTSLQVTPDFVILTPTQAFALTVTGQMADGSAAPQAILDAVAWSSDNVNVATVDKGFVTGVASGAAVVTAQVGDIRKEVRIEVRAAAQPTSPVTRRRTPATPAPDPDPDPGPPDTTPVDPPDITLPPPPTTGPPTTSPPTTQPPTTSTTRRPTTTTTRPTTTTTTEPDTTTTTRPDTTTTTADLF